MSYFDWQEKRDARPLRVVPIMAQLIAATLMTAHLAVADDSVAERMTENVVLTSGDKTLFHYEVKCRGCHLMSGEGTVTEFDFIPPLKDFVGNFLRVPGGRSYLVRVPGVYQTSLTDQETAELLNFIINKYAGKSIEGEVFQPFTAVEISSIRKSGPIRDVVGQRRVLMQKIRAIDAGDNGSPLMRY